MNQSEKTQNGGFSIALRGYNIEEVDGFLDDLCAQMDALSLENSALRDRLARAKRECDRLRGTVDRSEEERLARLHALDEAIAARRGEYDALIEKTKEFKQTLFTVYGEHIRALAAIGADARPTPAPESHAAETKSAPAPIKPAEPIKPVEPIKPAEPAKPVEPTPAPGPTSTPTQETDEGATKILPKLDEEMLRQLLHRKTDKPTAPAPTSAPVPEPTAAPTSAPASEPTFAPTPVEPERPAPVAEKPAAKEAAPARPAETMLFTAGLHVEREPFGSNGTQAYADFRDRLEKTGVNPGETAFKQKKYF